MDEPVLIRFRNDQPVIMDWLSGAFEFNRVWSTFEYVENRTSLGIVNNTWDYYKTGFRHNSESEVKRFQSVITTVRDK